MNSSPSHPILPGKTIGILGSGQLGRMMAIAARHLGYRIHVYSTAADSPAGQVADLEVVAPFSDLDSVAQFAEAVDVVTVETENIPLATLDAAAGQSLVRPGRRTLEVSQNRRLEKQFSAELGIPTCQFAIACDANQLRDSALPLLPAVAKTLTGGYDGKGQVVLHTPADVDSAWDALRAEEVIVEQWVDFDFEFSVIGARRSDGEFVAFPAVRNEHAHQILDISTSPAGLPASCETEATGIVQRLMDQLGTVGLLTVEFFYKQGQVLVNELAPRPHNSGHLTIEGHATNQFEQHIRTICGLPLGSPRQRQPVAMANLLGECWQQGEPAWHQALSVPEVHLHLYGKTAPRAQRKMGHVTALADDLETARARVVQARTALQALRETAT